MNEITTPLGVEQAQRALAGLLRSVGVEQVKPSRFPEQPPMGSVLRWERTFELRSGRSGTYDFIALRTPPGWYVTGLRGNEILPFEQLVERIGDNPCWLVTEYAKIPHLPGEAHSDVDNPRDWYRAVFGEEPGSDEIGPEPYNPGGYMDGSHNDWGDDD